MKIEFRTVISENNDYDLPLETHSIHANGKVIISQSEAICPEDVLFCRDLASPHDVIDLIKEVIVEASKGNIIEIYENVIKEEDFI